MRRKVSWRLTGQAVRWLEALENKVEAVHELKGENVFLSRNPDLRMPPQPSGGNEVGGGRLVPRSMRRSMAIKDNIATRSAPTTCASHALKDYHSPFDSTVVSLLNVGGARIEGKTNMDEFGMGSHSTNTPLGPVRMPHPQHKVSVGGSSGGSAVAVARNEAKGALGTDTGGSVRLPAAFTGTTGFKPSYGFVSRYGVVPYANSLDTVGVIAHSAVQILDLMPAISVHDPRDPTNLSPLSRYRISLKRKDFQLRTKRYSPFHFHHISELKIGVPAEYNVAELAPEVHWAWQKVLKVLADRGCSIVPVSLPNTKHALSAYYVLAAAEAASNLAKYDGVRYGTRSDNCEAPRDDVLYSATRGTGFGAEVKRRILVGSYTLSSGAMDNYFIKAQKVRRLVQKDFDLVFGMPNYLRSKEQYDLSDLSEDIPLETKLGPGQVDFIICPTTPTLPPWISEIEKNPGGVENYLNDVFTVPASLAGIPALSIPIELPPQIKKKNAPTSVGIQIIGQYADDIHVLQVGSMLQVLCDEDRMEHLASLNPEQEDNLKRLRESGAGPSIIYKRERELRLRNFEKDMRSFLDRRGVRSGVYRPVKT
ncbi:Trimeric GatFAB AmidoTransferase(AdT) complex subunit [Clarireedia jacksonii]